MKTGVKNITVFGSTEPVEGDKLYESARKLGEILAGEGYNVINGGYGGVMEAVSRGVGENGGKAVGITVEGFSKNENRWLDFTVQTEDIYSRLRELISRGDVYAVLDGKAGTFNELVSLWALKRLGELKDEKIFVVGARWSEIVDILEEENILGFRSLENTILLEGPEDILKYL